MALSSKRKGRPLDVTGIGVAGDDLPTMAATPQHTRFDLRRWWPAERSALPFELEIGSGKGTFLVQQATLRPDVNYLGIEWAKAYWRHASDRLRRHGLHNVRMLHADAGEFVPWYCPDSIFRVVHVYFPDPWPKKRHHKRRTINAEFLRELHRVLTPGGCVRLVTDHDDYFQWMTEHAERVGELFDREPFDRPESADEGEVVGTNFERKYRREGRPFNAMVLRRRAG